MRWLTGLIGSAGAPMIAKALIVVALIIGIGVWIITHMAGVISDLQQQIGARDQQFTQCQSDNEAQTAHLKTLGLEIVELTDRIAIEQDAVQQAQLRSAELERLRLIESLADAEAIRAIYAENESCQVWSLSMACTEIADHMVQRRIRLIERWEGDLP